MPRPLVLKAILLQLTAVLAFATDLFVGTWKLNPAKSTYTAGVDAPPRDATERIEKRGEYFISVDDRTLADGRTEHHELSMRFEGSGRPAIHLGPGAKGFIRRLNERTIVTTFMRDGTVLGTRIRTISEDGNTLTVRHKTKTAEGKSTEYEEVFDRARAAR